MHSKKILCILCSLFYGVLSRRPGPDNRPPPPPPPPHPPMPPIPVPSNSTEPMPTSESSHPIPPPPPPLIPHALLPNQCSFGVESAADTTDGYAEANTLYILAGDPAECSGTIDSLFFCFSMSELVRYSKHTIQFISFRQHYSSDGDLQSYRKLGRAHVDIEVNEESGGIACRIIKPNDTLSLSAGDVLGFVTEQGFHIALTNINDTHIFQFMPFEDELESIPATQSTTQQVNNTATPVLKIVMSKCLRIAIILCMCDWIIPFRYYKTNQ